MLDEHKLRNALDCIELQLEDYTDADQLRMVQVKRETIEWVLEMGPEVVLVPKPAERDALKVAAEVQAMLTPGMTPHELDSTPPLSYEWPDGHQPMSVAQLHGLQGYSDPLQNKPKVSMWRKLANWFHRR